ncbi:unnamed protein product [Amoebophrya sp. A25]|nr:unnamed protein product [Amoebophrya sp. A25]|eukprot:GSA25T00015029001.1
MTGLAQQADNSFPAAAYGTYKVGRSSGDSTDPVAVESAIKAALDAGYRCFDCAQFYENEKEIGEVLWKHANREEIYVISKVWTTTVYEGPEAVLKQLEQSLKDLQIGYVDLYLIHWPVPGKHVEAYKALQGFVGPDKKIRRLGLSNYTVLDYQELMSAEGITVTPYSNQFEVNPWLYRKKTISFFQQAGLKLQAYRPFADGRLLREENAPEEIKKIVAAHPGKTTAQVLLRWGVQKGWQVLPKSSTPSRIAENVKIFDFDLSEEEIAILDGLGKQEEYETAFKKNYEKCIVRDTPVAGSMTGKVPRWFDEED